MNMISNIKEAFSFKMTNSSELTHSEKVALKNIIELAKERIWLADPLSAMEYDDGAFDDHLSEETRARIKTSIKLMETYLTNNSPE